MDERFTDSGRSRPSDKVGPGLPDSEIKRGVEGAGSVSFGLKIRGGAGPSPGSGADRKCSIHKIKLKLNGKLDACVKSKQTTPTNRLG